jgi:hypothetical protein
VIFNSIIIPQVIKNVPSWKLFSDDGPLIAMFSMFLEHDPLLFLLPSIFIDGWIEVVVPSKFSSNLPLSALLSCAALVAVSFLHFLCDYGPLLSAINVH